MTDAARLPSREPPDPAIDRREWAAMVAAARDTRVVHADDVSHVLRNVELSSTLLHDVHEVLAAEGIAIDDRVDERVDGDPAREAGAAGAPVLSAARTAERADEATTADEGDGQADAADRDRDGDGDGDDAETALSRRPRLFRRRVRSQTQSGDGLSNTVQLYLKEIGQVDLLTAEGERQLAQAIEDGHAAAVALDHGGHDVRERRRLTNLVHDGQDAKSELIQANLRLVVSIAKRYSGRGMQLLDLVQEGNLGLMRAVDKFDHTKGFKFSTYATWWIRQSITRAIADQARTIRIPVHMVESMNRVQRTQRQLHQELEREPTIDELADRCALPPDRVRDMLRIAQDPLSLDSPVGEDEQSSLADFIEDSSSEAPADSATRRFLSEAVDKALGELSEREQGIVRMRFGLDDGKPQTLDDVGRAFGVTRERVRQIEAKTLAKLRHPQRSGRLKEFLESE